MAAYVAVNDTVLFSGPELHHSMGRHPCLAFVSARVDFTFARRPSETYSAMENATWDRSVLGELKAKLSQRDLRADPRLLLPQHQQQPTERGHADDELGRGRESQGRRAFVEISVEGVD